MANVGNCVGKIVEVLHEIINLLSLVYLRGENILKQSGPSKPNKPHNDDQSLAITISLDIPMY